MKFSAITGSNVEGFSYVLLPEAADAIRRGESMGALGVVDDEGERPAAAGAIAGVADNGVFRIVSLFVEERYRSRGFGQMLLDIYTGEIERFGLPQSIEFISTSEEHAGLERFLEHNGYERLDNTPLMVRAGLQDIHVTEDDIPVPNDPGQYAVFAELPDEILLQGNDLADAENRPLPEGGLLSERIIRDCSICLINNKETEAYAVIEHLSDNELLMSAIWCKYPVKDLDALFSRTVRAVKDKYPEDSYIYIYIDNDHTGDLAGRFCNEPEIVSRRYFKL